MIDIHAHVLPEADDGSSSIEETISMLRQAYRAGFTDVFATSHYIEDEYDLDAFDRDCIIQAIEPILQEEGINIKLHNGAEAYISNDLPNLIESGVIPTLGDSKYVLFELPLKAKVMYTESVIEGITGLGLVPIIAHPERYETIQEEPNIVLGWIEKGALLQSNYGSIMGVYGANAKETLLKLLKADTVHFLGTDTHRRNSFYIRMDEIKKQFIKEIGKEYFEDLSYNNSKSIIRNEKIVIPEPKKIKNRRFI